MRDTASSSSINEKGVSDLNDTPFLFYAVTNGITLQ